MGEEKIKRICAIPDKKDVTGVIITKEAMQKMEGENIPIFVNFDQKEKVGTAAVKFVEGEGLMAVMKIRDAKIIKERKISIGYMAEKTVKRNNTEIVQKAKIISVGIVNS